MSREQYQIPTTGSQTNFGSGADQQQMHHQQQGQPYGQGGQMYYTCGDCANRCGLEKGAPIRCLGCGGRVLYKERTKRMVQFEAR